MRNFIIIALCVMFTGLAVVLVHAELTQEKIKIETPKKKSKGNPTFVDFDHKKHAEEHSDKCEVCHPPIAKVVGDEVNTKDLVHKNCKQCHAKNKPGKTFKCSLCHITEAK